MVLPHISHSHYFSAHRFVVALFSFFLYTYIFPPVYSAHVILLLLSPLPYIFSRSIRCGSTFSSTANLPPPTIVIDKVSPLLVGYVLELLRIGWHCSHCSFFFCRFLDFSCMCMLLICFAVWHKSLVLRLMVGRQSVSWPCCRFHWFNEKKREQREEEGSNYEFARRPINRNMYQRCACVCVDVKLGEMCGGLTLRMYVVRSPHNTKTSRRTWSLVSNDSSVNG